MSTPEAGSIWVRNGMDPWDGWTRGAEDWVGRAVRVEPQPTKKRAGGARGLYVRELCGWTGNGRPLWTRKRKRPENLEGWTLVDRLPGPGRGRVPVYEPGHFVRTSAKNIKALAAARMETTSSTRGQVARDMFPAHSAPLTKLGLVCTGGPGQVVMPSDADVRAVVTGLDLHGAELVFSDGPAPSLDCYSAGELLDELRRRGLAAVIKPRLVAAIRTPKDLQAERHDAMVLAALREGPATKSDVRRRMVDPPTRYYVGLALDRCFYAGEVDRDGAHDWAKYMLAPPSEDCAPPSTVASGA